MKIRLTFKTPDIFDDQVRPQIIGFSQKIKGIRSKEERERVVDERFNDALLTLEKFIEYGEYISIEFDTDSGTAKVLENK